MHRKFRNFTIELVCLFQVFIILYTDFLGSAGVEGQIILAWVKYFMAVYL